MVLDQFLEHLHPAGKGNGAGIGLEQVGDHQRVHGAVLFPALVDHDGLGLLASLLEGRVENLLLQVGVHLQLGLQSVQQFAAGLHRALSGLAKLFQDLAEVLVILLE
ncbi:hypothetical protein D3C84_691150 [compost metagenome]